MQSFLIVFFTTTLPDTFHYHVNIMGRVLRSKEKYLAQYHSAGDHRMSIKPPGRRLATSRVWRSQPTNSTAMEFVFCSS